MNLELAIFSTIKEMNISENLTRYLLKNNSLEWPNIKEDAGIETDLTDRECSENSNVQEQHIKEEKNLQVYVDHEIKDEIVFNPTVLNNKNVLNTDCDLNDKDLIQQLLECNTCNQRFLEKSFLEMHILSHSNYKCNDCKSTFSSVFLLTNHRCNTNQDIKIGNAYMNEYRIPSFICNMCQKQFSTKIILRKHIWHAHGDDLKNLHSKVCKQTNKQIYNNRFNKNILFKGVQKHMGYENSNEKYNKCCNCRKFQLNLKLNINNAEDSYKCVICNLGFRKLSYLKRHNLTKHSGKSHVCIVCNEKYAEADLLKKHLISHAEKQCCTCNMNFHTKRNLSKHLKNTQNYEHYERVELTCFICKKSYLSRNGLRVHIRSHTGERPYECGICHQTFQHPFTLKTHSRVHTGEKPFKCDICSKGYSLKNSLTKHMRIHTGERPFKCQICKKGFIEMSALKNHMDKHNKKCYKCDVCSKQFKHKGNLGKHKRIHIEDKLHNCSICFKGYRLISGLEIHKKLKHPNLENLQ